MLIWIILWLENKPFIVAYNYPFRTNIIFFLLKKKIYGSGGIRTHASEETGALNQRLRPLGHATLWHSWCCCGKLRSRLDWSPDLTQQSQANWVVWQEQKVCPRWGSNSRPSDYETDALPTALRRLALGELWTSLYCDNLATTGEKNSNASAGNRTRVNCLEGSYAHHYTTDACVNQM